jgi:hypothetical protein
VSESAGHGGEGLLGRVWRVAESGEAGDAAHQSRFEDMACGFKRGGEASLSLSCS